MNVGVGFLVKDDRWKFLKKNQTYKYTILITIQTNTSSHIFQTKITNMEWEHFSSDDSEEENLMEETARITANYLIERTQRTRGLIRRSPLERDREGANETLFRHYFSPEPVYDEAHFRRRFRMSRQLFLRISNDLAEMYPFFQQKPDARGRPGFTPIQKCTAALRQLAYGISSDALDEYLEMSEKIACDSLHYFCQGMLMLKYILRTFIVTIKNCSRCLLFI